MKKISIFAMLLLFLAAAGAAYSQTVPVTNTAQVNSGTAVGGYWANLTPWQYVLIVLGLVVIISVIISLINSSKADDEHVKAKGRFGYFLGNVVWIVFGGLVLALEYFISGIMLCITIIGIPFGLQLFKLAGFSLNPFGRKVVNGEKKKGCVPFVMNILWFIPGLVLMVEHFISGILLAITIIGIPFAKQHFKLAGVALFPFGKEIVRK